MDFIETNGVGLRYELSGTGERTLVLVHEMGGSLESWDDVVPRFAGSRRVLRYDTRGAGLSQKIRGDLHIDTMADDIAALLGKSAPTISKEIGALIKDGILARNYRQIQIVDLQALQRIVTQEDPGNAERVTALLARPAGILSASD